MRFPGLRIIGVDKGVCDAEVVEVVCDEVMCTAIETILRQKVVTGVQHRQ